MFRLASPNTPLRLEALEPRDVPAIVLQGTQAQSGAFPRPVTPNGGSILIQEVIFAPSDVVVTATASGNSFANADAETRTKSPTAADTVMLTNNGDTLTISASDGIFLRYTNNNGTFFQFRGTTLDVAGVTDLKADLQLGGDDTVIDNTTFASTLNGGPGSDALLLGSAEPNPLLVQLLLAPGGLNPALLPLLAGGPTKALNGGDGNDKLTATGSAYGFTLSGGAGDDTINGSLFGILNTLDGGDGNDIIIGGLGIDVIAGGNGFDLLFGVGGRDFYLALDQTPDFIFNQLGDFVLNDPFDSRAVR